MRLEKVLETATEIIEQQIQTAYSSLQTYYDSNSKEIDDSFAEQISKLFDEGVLAQQEGKGAINYLAVSYLYSSLITGSGDFSLALHDDKFYFDDEPVCIYWSPEFLWSQYSKDIVEVEAALKGKLSLLQQYELDAVKMEYAERFFEIGHKMFADYIELISSKLESSELEITPDFAVVYGGYFDKVSLLWQSEGERT